MSQQINLFDPALRPRREWLTLRHLAMGLGAAMALSFLLGVWSMARESRELQRFQLVEGQLKAAQEELTALAVRQAGQRPDPHLEAELAQAKRQLQGKEDILALLERGDLGNRSGFSAYLRGFARQTLEGVWLTGLELSPAGQSIEIRGRLQAEALLPRYVQNLNREEVFRGRQFSTLDMRRVEPPKPGQGREGGEAGAPVPNRPFVEFTLAGQTAATVGKAP